MKQKMFLLLLLVIICCFCFPPLVVSADGCLECHRKHGVTINLPSVKPIEIMIDGKAHIITLDQAFKFHGHECPGMTIGYLAIQYGLNLLYPDRIPSRDDLLVTSITPAAGVKDMIDLLMKGKKPSDKTWPPAGMMNSREGFEFNIIRKSTCEAIKVTLNQKYFPLDFYPLKKKVKDKTITVEEWQKLHGYMKNIILTYPVKQAEELFGNPKPYKIILWGTLEKGELDKNIRKMRQEAKEAAIKSEKANP